MRSIFCRVRRSERKRVKSCASISSHARRCFARTSSAICSPATGAPRAPTPRLKRLELVVELLLVAGFLLETWDILADFAANIVNGDHLVLGDRRDAVCETQVKIVPERGRGRRRLGQSGNRAHECGKEQGNTAT